MKKMLWIVNPHAGRGAMRGKLIDCILTFQEAGFDVTLHVTEGPEDATRVAQARAGEFDRIVCAGGDGTLNEVVTGLMQSKVRPPLGYIPAGTTNDFATSLGIPKVPAEAAAIAAKDRLQALDIGRFNSRYFNYIAAFGVFTEVSYPRRSRLKTSSAVLPTSCRASCRLRTSRNTASASTVRKCRPKITSFTVW